MDVKRRYGWKPDLPDHRDLKFAAIAPRALALPSSVDLRSEMPVVYDQGSLGSCTSNAIAGQVAHALAREGVAGFSPSRLFIYYNERKLEGTIREDSGARIADGMRAIHQWGVPAEFLWPYSVAGFRNRPPASVYRAALVHRAVAYHRVDGTNPTEIKTALAQRLPVVFGFTVHESFESAAVAATGVVPLPGDRERVLGGHAVLAVGYDDATSTLIVRNSYGSGWGDAGYFHMPQAYATNADLASDFWVLQVVTK